MRAAAVALVLIVGAAIILWYGNTLNLLVLDGLIGGLAAILLSIPITLIVFAYLSRRQVAQFDEESEDRRGHARSPRYALAAEPVESSIYASDDRQYGYSPDEMRYEEQYQMREMPQQRLPARSQPRLPASVPARQQYLTAEEQAFYRQPAAYYSHDSGRYYRPGPVPVQQHGYERPTINGRRMYYAGSASSQANGQYSQQQIEGQRAARRQGQRPAPYGQQTPGRAAGMSMSGGLPQQQLRPAGQRAPQPPAHYRPQPMVEGTAIRPATNRRALPAEGASSASQSMQRPSAHVSEPRTDPIGKRYLPNADWQRSSTGQLSRNAQGEAQRRPAESDTGALNNTLARRAPYMYEDDALRYELSQQLSTPRVRRSSRSFEQ